MSLTRIFVAACLSSVIAQDLRIVTDHPRLILTLERAAELRDVVQSNADAAIFMERTRAQGAWLLTQKPFSPSHGNASLPNVRPILQRLYTLGILYRVDGNTTWAVRAVPELLNAAAADQWDLDGAASEYPSACKVAGNREACMHRASSAASPH